MVNKSRQDSVNKSKHIRAYLDKRPKATASEIIPALAAEGIEVSSSLVSNVKHSKKKKKGRKARVGRTTKVATQQTAARKTRAQTLTSDELLDAKKLVNQLGGADRLRSALDVLEQLGS